VPACGYPSDASVEEYDPVIAQEVLPGLECLLHSQFDLLMILGMNYLEQTFIVQLFIRGKMKQLPAFWCKPDMTGVRLHDPQARPRGICRQTQARLAFAQGLVRAFPSERVGKHLRDKLETLHDRVRPVPLLPQDTECQPAKGWPSSN
jgi:hypothetical protein